MRQMLAPVLAVLIALPALAQEAGAPDGDPVGAPVAAPAPDAVAAWEADPLAVLDGATVDLGAFEYAGRPLVVFADNPRQPQLAEQLRLIEADREGLARRDVAVIVDSDPDAGSALRRELRPRGFGVVLVDKDGRVVLRRPAPLTAREIAGAIDRTPIRREELRAAGEQAAGSAEAGSETQ